MDVTHKIGESLRVGARYTGYRMPVFSFQTQHVRVGWSQRKNTSGVAPRGAAWQSGNHRGGPLTRPDRKPGCQPVRGGVRQLKTSRQPLSKRVRFEIFKRDAFICQYCGQRPPDVVLEVDHIEPVAAGGSNDEINLITSCWDCNRGKAGRQLTERTVWADADFEFLKVQQEIAEARRFLETRKMRDEIQQEVVGAIQQYWTDTIRFNRAPSWNDYHPADTVIVGWMRYARPDEICQAILKGSGFVAYGARNFDHAIRYISGIIHNERQNKGEG